MAAADSLQVLGQYTIFEQLGRGGMATVNRAEMHGVAGFRKVVALKRLHRHVASDPEMVKLFIHEARLASHLLHPNVAQTYDLGKVDDTYFIAMEYVAGPTLAKILQQSATAAGPVPIPIALKILAQICEALDYAHNLCDDDGKPLGIIHRDVSPANIIVSTTGVVKLIDFGIAKATSSDKTKPGYVKGKFSYMAPEYLQGQLDLRADLFGLGVIAHELLTGRRLFNAKNDFATITALREMPIQPPSRWNPAIPRDLDDIVLTALQRDPGLRWQSASAMQTAITNVMRSLDTQVTNHQVIEWIEWAFKQERPREDSGLVRVIDSLDEPSKVTVQLSLDDLAALPRAASSPPVPAGEPAVSSEVRTTKRGEPAAQAKAAPRAGEPAAKAAPRPAAKVAPEAAPAEQRGGRRTWLLLLLLIALAVLTRDQLEVAGRALYAWAMG